MSVRHKSKIIKRRYKEFVLLQKILEDNAVLKPYLKNINGPAKYNNPFSKMDQENIDKRKRKLCLYLIKLAKIQKLCNSREFVTFLDIEENKSTHLNIDKNENVRAELYF